MTKRAGIAGRVHPGAKCPARRRFQSLIPCTSHPTAVRLARLSAAGFILAAFQCRASTQVHIILETDTACSSVRDIGLSLSTDAHGAETSRFVTSPRPAIAARSVMHTSIPTETLDERRFGS